VCYDLASRNNFQWKSFLISFTRCDGRISLISF
jgi:hypothetical protein